MAWRAKSPLRLRLPDTIPLQNNACCPDGQLASDMNMMQGMAVAYTGGPDVDFRLKIFPHHQRAIEVAGVALCPGLSLKPEETSVSGQRQSALDSAESIRRPSVT